MSDPTPTPPAAVDTPDAAAKAAPAAPSPARVVKSGPSFGARVRAAVAWLEVPANRRRFYALLCALAPLLVVAGFVTSDQVQHWLEVASSVLLLGGASLAKRHTVA